MTDETKTSDNEYNFNFWPSLLTIVFVTLAATGNCSACGLDHDYVSDVVAPECPE